MRFHLNLIRVFTLLLSFLGTFSLVTSPACAQAANCGAAWKGGPALPLALDETTLVDGPKAASARLFALEIPAPGLLAVELVVAPFETAETWLDLAIDTCLARLGKQPRALERSLNHQIWQVMAPGVYHVRVGTVVPGLKLTSYKLITRFVPTSAPLGIEKDGGVAECDDEIVPCPTPKLCTGQEPSNDLAFCAGALHLGRTAVEELSNAWGQDHDYFVFTVERPGVVRLETSGPVDTFGVLFDASGQRLAAADDGGEGENFALDAALRPGLYRVRVEGMPGAEGTYRLQLSESR